MITGIDTVYKKPRTQIQALTGTAYEYLTTKRGLEGHTLSAYKVGCTPKGNIALPYYDEDGELRLVKFRHPEGKALELKHESGEIEQVKTYLEKGGKPILFGSHLADPLRHSTLTICFGEYDAMAAWQAGIPNPVSPPYGDKGLQFIKEQWDFLQLFETIVLFFDNDTYPDKKSQAKAQLKRTELVERLGTHRVKVVKYDAKDPNELLLTQGPEALMEAWRKREWFPEEGLIRVADYEDPEFVEGVPTGFHEMDRTTGGIASGNLILIAGDNSAGKTTVALNILANSVDLSIPCLYWSGEQPVGRIRYWFERIAAGPSYLRQHTNERTGFSYYFPQEEYLEYIRAWYRDYFYQYTDFFTTKEKFFQVAEVAVRRYGIKRIFIDNLMAFTGGEGDSYFQAQGDFTQSCKMFAERWGVGIVLIAHNRKRPKEKQPITNITDKIPGKDDVEGSRKVTNWADIVIQMYRLHDQEKGGEFGIADSIAHLCKCRESGSTGYFPLVVDLAANRLSEVQGSGEIRRHGWEILYQNETRKMLSSNNSQKGDLMI